MLLAVLRHPHSMFPIRLTGLAWPRRREIGSWWLRRTSNHWSSSHLAGDQRGLGLIHGPPREGTHPTPAKRHGRPLVYLGRKSGSHVGDLERDQRGSHRAEQLQDELEFDSRSGCRSARSTSWSSSRVSTESILSWTSRTRLGCRMLPSCCSLLTGRRLGWLLRLLRWRFRRRRNVGRDVEAPKLLGEFVPAFAGVGHGLAVAKQVADLQSGRVGRSGAAVFSWRTASTWAADTRMAQHGLEERVQ